MPGMWQKTMVYLGLKDDDEGYEYDYDDELDLAEEEYVDAQVAPIERPTRAPRRGARRAGRRGSSPGCGRCPVADAEAVPVPTIRPMPASSARVHVVEPHGFNDAQEVGDRLKADQPVIINLQGLGRDLQRRLIDFSSGLTYAIGGTHVARRRPGVPAHAEQRRGLPGGEGAAAGPRPVRRLTRAGRPLRAPDRLHPDPLRTDDLLVVPAHRRAATATVARLLFDLTEPVLAPLRRIIPPVGMFDLSFTVAGLRAPDPLAARCARDVPIFVRESRSHG